MGRGHAINDRVAHALWSRELAVDVEWGTDWLGRARPYVALMLFLASSVQETAS